MKHTLRGTQAACLAVALALSAATALAQTSASPAKPAARDAARDAKTTPRAERSADPASASAGDAVSGVRKQLAERFPGGEIRHVAKSPFFGLYEVLMDGQLIYTDAKVSYVFVGNVYDPVKRVNLTQDRLQELTAVNVDELPLELAIKTVKGTGARKLVVFSDVDCPFCKRLEEELKTVNDVTIYTFLFPIESLHPDAARKSKLVWCASDREKAYLDIMQKGVAPASSANCDDPVERIVRLGEKLRIQATPTLIFADGRVVPGALPKAQLEAQFARVEASLKPRAN